MSLRAELLGSGPGRPSFAVLLPAGWEAVDPDFASMEARTASVLEALPVETRGVVRRHLDSLREASRTQAAKGEVVAVLAPVGTTDGAAAPVALAASWMSAPRAGTAADLGGEAISRWGAAPLDPGGTILRWSLDATTSIEDGEVEVAGHGYLLRVPGDASAALVFRSTILREAGGSRVADEGIAAMARVCDAIVASLRWKQR